ncbi:MAG: hypothetical protein GY906_12970 [bacterium]|nr:hypothetical protein [bacterium]
MLIVTQKGSILAAGGRVLTPGTKIARGVFTDPQVKEHIRSGFLAEVREGAPPPENPTPDDNPVVKKDNVGDGSNPSMTTTADIEGAEKSDKTVVAGAGGGEGTVSQGTVEKTEEQPAGEPLVHEGKWNINPAALASKSLDALNLMVIGRDETIDPFETVEEAAAFLSQDWREPKEE